MTELDWRDLVLNLIYLLKAYEAQYTIPPTGVRPHRGMG